MKIRKLNTLRGLAALIVLVSHYSNESGLWGGAFGHGAGQLGVMIFFLLSSFLMTYLYLEIPPTAYAIKNYAIARIARVIPLYLVVVIACFAAQHSESNILRELTYNINSVESLLLHLFLLRGENVLWTIPTEIHFYIIFACVWFLSPRFWKGIMFLSVLTLATYASGILPGKFPVIFLESSSNTHPTLLIAWPYFIVGFLLGYAFNHWRPPVWLCSHWFVATLLLIPFLYPIIFFQVTGSSHGLWLDPRILVCVSIIFFVVVFLVPPENAFLENRIGDKIGDISYSLYLLHLPLLLAMKKVGLATGVLGLFIFLILSLTVAFISFSLFEAPMRRRIRSVCLPNNSLGQTPQSDAA